MVIQSVKSETTAHWFVPMASATRQNAPSRAMRARPRNPSRRSDEARDAGCSGTMNMNTADSASAAAASAAKISRQLKMRSAISTGAEALMAPRPPIE